MTLRPLSSAPCRHLTILAGTALLWATIPGLQAATLLAAWEFNAGDISGSSVAASGGTASNTTGTLQADAAIVSGALSLDGTGDYLQFGNDVTELRPAGGTLTIAAWVNTDVAITALRRIVEHEDNIYFWAESGLFQYTTHGTPGTPDGRAQSTTAPTVGVWQHMAVTVAPNQPASIYINGVLEGVSVNNQVPIPSIVHSFQIGARRNASGPATNFWDGQIDDVAIWDGFLSMTDIAALAGVGNGGYAGRTVPTLIPEPSAGLLAGVCGLLVLVRRRRGSAGVNCVAF
jgi:hypothetical protein